jgi:hypothetical protein
VQATLPVDHREALERGARLGYAAQGVVYLIVGGLAFLAASAAAAGRPTRAAPSSRCSASRSGASSSPSRLWACSATPSGGS